LHTAALRRGGAAQHPRPPGFTLPEEEKKQIAYKVKDDARMHEGLKFWWIEGWIGLPK
jgi:hypothetical protein